MVEEVGKDRSRRWLKTRQEDGQGGGKDRTENGGNRQVTRR
jgi:hypothetical protein